MLNIDRRSFFNFLGGSGRGCRDERGGQGRCARELPYLESRCDGLSQRWWRRRASPPWAELEAQIPTRTYRRGAGKLFAAEEGNVPMLAAMPAKPTLTDFIRQRFQGTSEHCLQSARLARTKNADEKWCSPA